MVGGAIIVDEHRLIAALVAVGPERLQERVRSRHLIRNCDTDARLLVALVLELKMEEHYILAGLRIAHHLRALDDTPGLDIMPDCVGDRKRDAAVGPIDEILRRIAMYAYESAVAEVAVNLVFPEPIPPIAVLEDAAAVSVDVISVVVIPDAAVHVLAGNGNHRHR